MFQKNFNRTLGADSLTQDLWSLSYWSRTLISGRLSSGSLIEAPRLPLRRSVRFICASVCVCSRPRGADDDSEQVLWCSDFISFVEAEFSAYDVTIYSDPVSRLRSLAPASPAVLLPPLVSR